jgi:hypothetical protein
LAGPLQALKAVLRWHGASGCRRDRSTVRREGARRRTARALARGHHAVVIRGNRRHEFDDGAEARAVLRSPPAREALTWVADCVGSEVVEWNVLRGGTSSAMYALTVGAQASTHLVLRCYVRADLNEEEPALAEREAAALRVIAATTCQPRASLPLTREANVSAFRQY